MNVLKREIISVMKIEFIPFVSIKKAVISPAMSSGSLKRKETKELQKMSLILLKEKQRNQAINMYLFGLKFFGG